MKDSTKRIIKSGWTNFRRNSWLSFGTTGVMTLSLLVLIGLIASNASLQGISSSLKEKVDVSAYFKFEATEDQILEIKSQLELMSQVKTIAYISEEQALAIFKERHKSDELIQSALDELGNNPLQASLSIKAKDPNQYVDIVNFLEGTEFNGLIEKVNYYENEKVISKIDSLSKGLNTGGALIALILAIISILIAFNTIRLTIYSQRQEIEIMRLVGASNWQIQGPYIMEGSIYGIIAGLISLAISYPIILLVSPKIHTLVPDLNLFNYFVSYIGQIIGLVIISGIALGIISSIIAIRRYLKK